MSETDASRYHALRSKDARFDGVFFVGVLSTGIYCRPVCPSRTPLRKNCRFFPLAALAQQAGFRPCLRCRPEVAPERHRQASDTLVTQLSRVLRDAALEGTRISQATRHTGWSARQLRRKLVAECGLTPVAIMQTERLLFAKRLLHDTALPMTEVAHGAGFRSVRRFNTVFAEKCGLTPTAVRRAGESGRDEKNIALRLDYRAPYAWREMLEWLRARATRGVESVTDEAWQRTVSISGHQGWLCVTNDKTHNRLKVEITPALAPVLPRIVRRLRHLFDLDANPAEIAPLFATDPLLGPVAKKHPGLRVPGAWDVFESAVRTVIGQQVTVVAASTVASRLACTFGKPCSPNPHDLQRHAVTPRALASASIGDIASLGMPAARAQTLRTLAENALKGALNFTPFATLESVRETLVSMPGIGPWTADYIALRALRHPDAFPAGDLGLRKAIGHGKTVSIADAERASRPWKPWRAYAAALLWQSLSDH
jgi:AraC family transcriptional regulator, regulatory protein of adaptative response / DNA-3-methyladenine glycosylase II